MTLPAPKLDDLTWADMMAAIRRRTPAESNGTWTLHAPVDPGITLLELFAYLLEQRLYWLDQVPDALVVAVLRLLGLEPPHPARPAATVLRVEARRADAAVPVVPAGTALTRDPAAQVVFTLDDDVAVFPLAEGAEATVTTGRDRTADLASRRGVPLLASDGAPACARFTLPLTGAHPAPGPLSLLFELDAPAASAPSWLPGAVADVPPPAELTWSWFRPGTDVSGPFEKVEDGTAGLRRSGVVRLHPPAGWTTRDHGILLSTRAATHAAPPRLLQLAVNVSTARHRQWYTAGEELQEQIDTWLKLPGQHLVLPDAAERLIEARVRLAGEEWRPVPDLTFGGPADRVFVLDRTEGAVVFGDGLTGRIPRPGSRASVEYAIGGGRSGNGGMTANWVPAGESPAAVTAVNVVRAEGGAEPESVTEARQRAAASLGEVTRAVTADDFVTLARTTPGVAVARAYASLGEHPGFPCSPMPGAVTVHLVPAVPRDDMTGEDFVAAPRPDPGMLCAVAAHLERARLLTSEVFVRAPRYRDVAVRADLSGDPADRARVSTVLTEALRRFLDPLVGGDDRDGWPFGRPLHPSVLLRAAQQALGDLADVSAVAIGLDGAAPDEACREVPLGPGDLPVLRTVRTRIVPAAEPGEGLA